MTTKEKKRRSAHGEQRPPRARQTLVVAPHQSGLSLREWTAGMASALLLWAAFPPVGAWPLAWIAPAGWCWWVGKSDLGGKSRRRVYLDVFAIGLVHILLVFQWVRLPHWSASLGWLALSLYLAVYVPAFVALARTLVHRGGWPIWLACPVVWCGLEWVRGNFLTGFAMGLLGHTQVTWTPLVQIADLGGAYLVGFLVMLVAAAVTQSAGAMVRRAGQVERTESLGSFALYNCVVPLVVAGASLGVACGYGLQRIERPSTESTEQGRGARILLIQGSRDTTFSAADDPNETLAEYRRITAEAMSRHPGVDLVVWPESMHTIPIVDFTMPISPPPEFDDEPEALVSQLTYSRDRGQFEAGWIARQFHVAALIGCAAIEFGPGPVRRYNRALWVDRQGNVAGSYDKMHPVMFGEYVPLGKWFPWLYRLTPMGSGLDSGTQPLAVKVGDVALSPTICYENTVPHLLRRQFRTLAAEGAAPDALVTISNDGWFWGSSQLDMHLACAVFRAIEVRRPALVAANTGFSAEVDDCGRVRQKGPRRDTGYLYVQLNQSDRSTSVYLLVGDAFALTCLVMTVLATWWARRSTRDLRFAAM